jgi:translation initiation factor 2A
VEEIVAIRETMASFLPADLPVTQVLVRTRDEIQVYNGPTKTSEDSDAAALKTADLFKDVKNLRICPLFAPDGSLVCYVFENRTISICSTATGAEVTAIPITDAEYVEFSPKGTYLLTWSRPHKGSAVATSDAGNMKVWHVATGALESSFSQKVYRTQVLQWTANEEFCFRLVSNEVQIFNNSSMSKPVDKVHHKGLTQFHVTPTISPYVSVAVFNPEAGGKPARVTLYRFDPSRLSAEGEKGTAVEGPVSSRTIFAASEAKLTWNTTGSALLVYAHADTDASSYYGATGLFLLQAHTDAAIKVSLCCISVLVWCIVAATVALCDVSFLTGIAMAFSVCALI